MATRHDKPRATETSPHLANEPVGMETGYRILSYLAAGIIFYGGGGWLLDRWLGTGFLMPLGLVIGLCLAMFVIVKRYSREVVMQPHDRSDNDS